MRSLTGNTLTLLAVVGLSMIDYSSACAGRTMLRATGISSYEKQLILDMHNRMRQSLALGHISGQPPAADMMEMKWDNELANQAQKWAMHCQPKSHDQGRHISRFLVGQNLASTWTTKTPSSVYEMESDFPDAINKWFNEFKYYRYGRVGEGHAGHYTQMIWGETNLVGCGYSFYYDPSTGFTKNHVCNYGPSGNVLGAIPYHKGYPSCTNHGLSDSSKYPGLCDKPSNYYYGLSNYLG